MKGKMTIQELARAAREATDAVRFFVYKERRRDAKDSTNPRCKSIHILAETMRLADKALMDAIREAK